MRKTKYLLTTSEDRDVIVAEVPENYKYKEKGEYIVSQAFIDVNVKSGNFLEVTGKVDWDGRIWILDSDFA